MGPIGLGQGSIFMDHPQEHNSQQWSVTHFKPIVNFGQKCLLGGGGGRKKSWQKGYLSKIDKIFKIFIDKKVDFVDTRALANCIKVWCTGHDKLCISLACTHLQWLWPSRTSSRRFLQLGLKETFTRQYLKLNLPSRPAMWCKVQLIWPRVQQNGKPLGQWMYQATMIASNVNLIGLKSLHFILAQSGNFIIATACSLKFSWKEHNWNTVTLLEERSDKSRLSLSILDCVDRLLMSQMGVLMMYW